MATFVVRSPIQHFPDTSPARMKVLFPSETFVDASGNAVTTPFAIYDPDLTAVAGQPEKFWKLNGDRVELMNPAEQRAVLDAEETALKDALAAEYEAPHPNQRRGEFEVDVDEINDFGVLINEIIDISATANNFANFQGRMNALSRRSTKSLSNQVSSLRTKLDG